MRVLILALAFLCPLQFANGDNVDPVASLAGEWSYTASPDLGDGNERTVSRRIRFEENGGVFRTLWLRDFTETSGGKLIGAMRMAGFSREQYRQLDNGSLELIWRDFDERMRPEDIESLDELESSALATNKLTDRVENGEVTTIMGGKAAHFEVLVFLDKDTFLRIERTHGRTSLTSVTRYERIGEQAGTGQPATRPESKAEGSDKPQPEAEGRSR